MAFLWKNNLYRDFIIAFIILISPFLFYLYTLVPLNTYQWNTNYFNIDLRASSYKINKVFWYLSYKSLFIGLLSIWYVTCKHKWRYVILIPIMIEFHKLVGYFFDINDSSEQYRIYFSLLISLPFILFLTYLSVKLNYYSFKKNINQQLDKEIDDLINNASRFNKKKYRELKSKLIQLREEKNQIPKIEYLTQLIKLREEYSEQK